MPTFGLPLEYREYACTTCGELKKIQTNHTDACFDHCPNCSWRGGMGETGAYHPGYRAFAIADTSVEDKLSGLEIDEADALLPSDFDLDPKDVWPAEDTPAESSCGKICHVCGKPCTRIHSKNKARLTEEHICQDCDTQRFDTLLDRITALFRG